MSAPAKKILSHQGHDAESRPEAAPEHDALLAAIAADARLEPERYLEDSIVPEGGE